MTVDRASDNPFPSVLFAEHVDPSNPAAGYKRLFVDTDHVMKTIDSSGTVVNLGQGLTDPMTTRGDIIYRNSSNVTARLARGSATQVLTSDGTDLSWQTPTSGFADPMTTRGDVIVRNSSNATARLAVGATSGMMLRSNGTDPAWALPPGYQWDYAQITSAASITASTAGTANTVVSGNSVTYDGTDVIITISAPWMQTGTGGNEMVHLLYLDGSNLLEMGREYTNLSHGPQLSVIQTPSAGAHTYSWRCYTNGNTGTRQVNAGNGTSGAYRPAYIRVTKA